MRKDRPAGPRSVAAVTGTESANTKSKVDTLASAIVVAITLEALVWSFGIDVRRL